jgi:hypothetical protein
MAQGIEELSIKKIEGGIRGIRMGTKTPETAKVGYFLNKLEPLNVGLYEDYLEKYVKVMKLYNEKKDKKSKK